MCLIFKGYYITNYYKLGHVLVYIKKISDFELIKRGCPKDGSADMPVWP